MKIEIIKKEGRFEYDELDYGTVFICGDEYFLRVESGAISLTDFKNVGFKANCVVVPCKAKILENL